MRTTKNESSNNTGHASAQQALFTPDLVAWTATKNNALTKLLVERGMLPRTVRQYEIHWLHFIGWLKAKKIELNTVDHKTIEVFLTTLVDAKRQQRERYQHVIKIALEAILEQPKNRNPALLASDVRKTTWRAVDANKDTQFLSNDEIKVIVKIIKHLPEHIKTPQTRKANLIQWRYLRLRAMICVFLGGGAKVSEAISLSVSCMRKLGHRYMLDYSDYIHRATGAEVPAAQGALHAYKGQGKGADREVVMPAWCTKAIDDWLRVPREKDGLLFPSAPRGGAMSPSTVARNVDQFSKICEIPFTAQKLRNAFGAILIDSDKKDAELSRLMGFSDSAGAMSAWRLRTNYEKWQADQRPTSGG